ncbi:hypothetical protein L1049_013117 [Liquidambar formosana]|uniref:Zinc-ribbon domain-containing protein n=1 Tax=Liquidambar formosana TaxID=63359 RepID=A0AAP0RL42_LIQFO
MSDSAKLRVVRCPKCENLLPELADYSVYQCGGCGAVLRAKKGNPEVDTLSEKSNEERVGGISAKLENFSEEGISKRFDNFSEKGIANLSDASESDVKSNSSSSSYKKRKDHLSKVTSDKWAVENDIDMNMITNELGNANMGTEYEGLKPQVENASGSRMLGRISDWRSGERGEMEGFRRNPKTDGEGVRFSTSQFLDEGPSTYYSDSTYGYGEALKNRKDLDGSNRVEYLEQDRAELLRKLDELKDQISRSCNVVEKPKENVPLDKGRVHQEPFGGSDTWFPDGSSGSNRGSMQFFAPDKNVARPPYYSHYPEPYPFANRHEMAMHSVYPSMHTSDHIPGYGDPFQSQMLKRAPHQAPGQYQQQPPHPYLSGQYMDADPDLFERYPHNAIFHQPSCSCFHCYEKHQQVPAPVPPSTFCNKRFPDAPNNPMFYHHENRRAFDPRVYNSRISNPPPMNSHDPRPQTRWPGDLNSDMGGFVRCHPQRVVLAKDGRRCRPIAGAAPFMTCYNCFELLQLPKKVLLVEKSQRKMRCGACSTVIYFSVVEKKIVVSVHAETKETPKEIDNDVVNGGTSHSHGHVNRSSMNFCSDDYDNSGYDFPSMEREPVSSSTGQDVNSSKSQETQSLHSSSSTTSEDEDCRDGLIAPREVTNCVDLPKKATVSPPPPGSPLQEHFDYSSNNHAVNRFGKGNRSSRSDQEKVTPIKATSRQNSVKDASMATEMEVSFNEYANTEVSQDTDAGSKEEDHSRINKGGESFFAGIIKKSFRDLSRSNQTTENEKPNITINGHAIPDRLIKKAEKLAGPIQPGQYWYDFRAGFWGVMGGPCLGIIPPSIEEFDYPMPESCAGGNTGVFVNGRELHKKDFNLLASRGLPTGRDKSYIIEISGRVLDEDSGEELDSLGKLAPTVEKVKHGFGMKVPKSAA